MDRFFVNTWVRELNPQNLICMTHGQNTYIDLCDDKIELDSAISTLHGSVTVFSPSKSHSTYLKKFRRNINFVDVGNTRFDRNWLQTKKNDANLAKYNFLPHAKLKLLLTLSKLE